MYHTFCYMQNNNTNTTTTTNNNKNKTLYIVCSSFIYL